MPLWEKGQYYLRKQEVKVVKAFGDEKLEMEYNSKRKEYEALKPFFGREQLFTKDCTWEAFLKFTDIHPQFLVKPDDTDCGEGIRFFDVKDYSTDDKKKLFESLQNEDSIIDERIIQHHKLGELCPGSVNTVRFVTVKIEGVVHHVGAALRMGSGTSIVDNFTAGGVVGAIDITTGIIIADGEDKKGDRYKEHPFSHVPLKGFQIPNWEEVLKLVDACAEAYCINYVGWDIGIRENDAVLVEANIRPMIHAYQVAGNGGKRKVYDQLLKMKVEENNK